jgi:hypothetical protein
MRWRKLPTWTANAATFIFLISLVSMALKFRILNEVRAQEGRSAAMMQLTKSVKSSGTCDCDAEFDSMVKKIETDYIGYRMMLPTMDRSAYERLKKRVRVAASSVKGADCFITLKPYVDSFHDGHVFLSEQPELSPGQIANLSARAEALPWNEETLRAYLSKNSDRLDPIEGVWYSDGYRIGIERNKRAGLRDFAAVMLSDGVQNWKVGQVKANIRSVLNGGYVGIAYYGDHSIHHLEGRIYKGLLLRMPPLLWGKQYPVPTFDEGLLDPTNPRAPTLKLLETGTVVVSIPSHSPEFADKLNALIQEHDSDLRSASLVIADIRGDEGGSAQTSDALAPFYYSTEQRTSAGVDGRPVVLSSPDQIKYFEMMEMQSDPASDWGKLLFSLVKRLKQNPGRVIPLSLDEQPDLSAKEPARLSVLPHHFAILMDRGDVSAAEAFVLAARIYERVTLFGENTGGTIDYQNVQMLPLDCKPCGLWIGFPTIASSDLLPSGGFNRVGIPPDVRIDPEVADKIRFIVDYFAKS